MKKRTYIIEVTHEGVQLFVSRYYYVAGTVKATSKREALAKVNEYCYKKYEYPSTKKPDDVDVSFDDIAGSARIRAKLA